MLILTQRRRSNLFVVFTLLAVLLFSMDSSPARRVRADDTRAIDLELWHSHTEERQAALQALVDEFNTENDQGIHVQLVGFQNSGLLYDQIVLQLLDTRSLPNLAMIWPHEAALFDLGQALVDLNVYLNDSANAPPYTFLAGVLDRGYNPFVQKQLGLPDRTFTEIMAVNLDALNATGYDRSPHTQAELLEMACAFRDRGGWDRGKFGVAWGFVLPMEAEFLLALNGEPVFAAMPPPRYALDTPALHTTLETLLELNRRECVRPVQTSVEGIDEFAAGQALFFFGSSSSLGLLRNAIGRSFAIPFDWGIFSLPGASQALTFGPLVSIFDHDDESNLAAWRFLEWFLRPAINAEWNRVTGSLPVIQGAGEAMQGDFEDFKQWRQAWQGIIMRDTMSIPAAGGYDALRVEIQFTLQRLLAGTEAIEQELPELERRANQILLDFAPIAETNQDNNVWQSTPDSSR